MCRFYHNPNLFRMKSDSLDIIYGNIYMACSNLLVGSTLDAAELTGLTQARQVVVGRL